MRGLSDQSSTTTKGASLPRESIHLVCGAKLQLFLVFQVKNR